MKKYLLIATALVALASCSDDTFVGENSPNTNDTYGGDIKFGLSMQKQTRGDIYGASAAELLGNNFYVTGTKGEEQATYPTPTLVFDNYLVHYGANTAGTTESNTANWEYVGIDQATGVMRPSDYSRVKLSDIKGAQTIKYWDYSVPQYDFLAFSTGTFAAVKGNSTTSTNIGVTAMKYGKGLDVASSVPTAYTFDLPSVDALKETYITDITEVAKANFGKEVQLKFKNLGSKVRVALYETIPGYSVRDVKFYSTEGLATPTDLGVGTGDDAYLISPSSSIPTAGEIEVKFPHVGVNHSPEATGDNTPKTDYDKASVTVTPKGTNAGSQAFGELTSQLIGKDRDEVKWDETEKKFVTETGTVFLGRDLPHATFAGSSAAQFYQTVFPVSTSAPLVLRVDYTLVPIDGAYETITVKGAKAVVPSTYTVWQPNYAYTYIFKITDNTNGWTGTTAEVPGLFPITFDAVVAEATDANAEQTTITTVATPTITTYQQNHNPNTDGTKIGTDEYSKATRKNIYVQVMDNSTAPATPKEDLADNTPEGKAKSLLYLLDNDDATEAIVMDALEKRTATYSGDAATIKGRNSLLLTKQTITNKVNTIVNGVDDNPIDITISGDTKSKAAMITIYGDGALDAGTYAYVYDYTATSRTEIEEYQPIVPGASYIESDASTKTFYTITTTQLNGKSTESATVDLTAAGANNYLYFSKTENGTGTTTYSYISIVGKTTLPAGVVKIEKSSAGTAVGNTAPVTGTFYFDKYFSNNGKYAVKVIKIVNS